MNSHLDYLSSWENVLYDQSNISMVSPTDRTFESSSITDDRLSDECNLSEVELSKRKIISKRQLNCTNDMYTIVHRCHRLNLSSSEENLTSTKIPMHQSSQQTNTNLIHEESGDRIWTSSDDRHRTTSTSKSSSITDFYLDSYSSSSSISSFDLHSSNPDSRPELKTFSSSSGYNSSLNSIPDHLFSSATDSILIPDCHLVEQDITSSSFSSQEPISTTNSPSYCRKCIQNNQLSSDTDDDSQSTTISTDFLPYQQQTKRPRSLPIAIQQLKNVLNDDETDNDSPFYHCTLNLSQTNRFRTCELTAPISENGLKLHINEQITVNQKHSLEHFIMSPTDRVKIQMKYQENDIKNNELKISQPEEIDFKRSKVKAIRILYQNRLHLNSIQSPVKPQNSTVLPSRTAGYCDSPLAKRTVNPRLFRSVISCSVFEADDEHEVVSSTTRTGVTGTHEKSRIETFNCLRNNFTESLLHGKILPCGILDGFTVKLGASGLFIPKQVVLPVTTFWFNVSEHQAASPYLGFINLQCLPKRGYHTPIKGTITIALLNPNGTAVHLFLILYDLSDMPPDHRTFIRQRVVLMPENTGDNKQNLRYLAHIRFVTSQTGKLYMHSDIRLIFARNKLDYDERTGTGKPQLTTLTDMPTPKYWSRK